MSVCADMTDLVRSLAERNPQFAANAQEALSTPEYKGKKLIVYCGMGGTLKVFLLDMLTPLLARTLAGHLRPAE